MEGGVILDWDRAKSILIVSFLLLNAILGYQLWSTDSKTKEFATDESMMMEELNRIMWLKKITIVNELPKDIPELSEITVKYQETVTSTKAFTIKTPTTMISILSKMADKNIQAQINIPHFDSYRLDSVTSKGVTFIFNQLHEQYPMFDVNTSLFEEDGLITTYVQSYVEVIANETNQKQKVIPASVAVRNLVENYLEEGAVINDIKLGYHGQIYDSQTQFMLPSWRVVLNGGDMYYIQAFNGSIEFVQQDEK